MLDAFRQYVASGAAMTTGFHPADMADIESFKGAVNPNLRNMTFGPYLFGFDKSEPLKAPTMYGKIGKGGMGLVLPMLGIGAQIGGTGYMLYQGFQENGMAGAKDALMLDLAVNSAMAAGYSYDAQTGAAIQKLSKMTMSGQMLSRGSSGWKAAGGTIGFIKASMGGYALGGIGQAIAGVPGAFAGAYLGAKMGRGVSSLVIAGGAIAAAAGAEVVKRGSAILKAGYMNQQMRRRIDTAGSMASYMTQNAYTERSRAVQAMHRSHLNARSALGSEAGYMHRNTDYFSRYKRF